jgi:hypothetical protein
LRVPSSLVLVWTSSWKKLLADMPRMVVSVKSRHPKRLKKVWGSRISRSENRKAETTTVGEGVRVSVARAVVWGVMVSVAVAVDDGVGDVVGVLVAVRLWVRWARRSRWPWGSGLGGVAEGVDVRVAVEVRVAVKEGVFVGVEVRLRVAVAVDERVGVAEWTA